jgi:hypothetical protein
MNFIRTLILTNVCMEHIEDKNEEAWKEGM